MFWKGGGLGKSVHWLVMLGFVVMKSYFILLYSRNSNLCQTLIKQQLKVKSKIYSHGRIQDFPLGVPTPLAGGGVGGGFTNDSCMNIFKASFPT